eukprot:scaffold128032_cov66-Phaeocystis_antarctica.AAC.3
MAPCAQRLISACASAQPSRKIIRSGACASRHRPPILCVSTMRTTNKTAFCGKGRNGAPIYAPSLPGRLRRLAGGALMPPPKADPHRRPGGDG